MKFTRSAARVATGGFDFFRFFTSTLYHKGPVINHGGRALRVFAHRGAPCWCPYRRSVRLPPAILQRGAHCG